MKMIIFVINVRIKNDKGIFWKNYLTNLQINLDILIVILYNTYALKNIFLVPYIVKPIVTMKEGFKAFPSFF